MKKLLSIFGLVIFSQTLVAMSVSSYCNQFGFTDDQLRCFQKASERFVDHRALDICQRFSFQSERRECISWVVNKQFNKEELLKCQEMSFDSDRKNCLMYSGREIKKVVDHRSIVLINEKAGMALESMRRGELSYAYRITEEIFNITDIFLNQN